MKNNNKINKYPGFVYIKSRKNHQMAKCDVVLTFPWRQQDKLWLD